MLNTIFICAVCFLAGLRLGGVINPPDQVIDVADLYHDAVWIEPAEADFDVHWRQL